MLELMHKLREERWQKIYAQCNEEQLAAIARALQSGELQSYFDKAISCSDYVFSQFKKRPQYILELASDATLTAAVDAAYFTKELSVLEGCENEQAFDEQIRRLRQYQMLKFILRDMHKLCSTTELINQLSYFADAAIQAVLDWHFIRQCEKYGRPLSRSGNLQRMLVLAMGKLGAYELNLSSDIDLIFAYPESGETDGESPISNQQFFLKLGQKIIKSLDKVTAEGFVFRVDMRLRPYGQSGALAVNFDALELYYEEQGREWERYALIKARPVAGDLQAAKSITQRLKPFIFKRYTDFSAIQSLRDMKAMITREVKRLGKENDVKLGAGGIREIEFIAQAYQLIYGGRDEALQERSVIKVLPMLQERGLLAAEACTQLLSAYFFLRDCEHAIQALNDAQTQKVPVAEPALQQFLSYLGYDDFDIFNVDMQAHRKNVRSHFEAVVAEDDAVSEEEVSDLQQLWLQEDSAIFLEELQLTGFSEQEALLFVDFKEDSRVVRLEGVAAERLNRFMPQLMTLMLELTERDELLRGVLGLVYAVIRRTSYLVLLSENIRAFERLLQVANASPWVMGQIVKHPVLLDELLSSDGLGRVPESTFLNNSLQQQGLRIAVDDLEEHMLMLRYFRLAHHLHIVAAEVSGKLPLMKISDYLSFLADAILAYVMRLSWSQMVARYGYPTLKGEPCTEAEFAIIAYGKLGGLELSHNSDLDLVFLYRADDFSETDGDNPVENRVFFTRMGQRIIHILSTQTILGPLYDVDMRLRPSGGKGLLVSSLNAFDKYQSEQAWTWEHQALVRGRAVAGEIALIREFQVIRQRELQRPRDSKQLALDVCAMRLKMYEHLTPADCKKADAKVFHLKHSRGGIVDIEFMVQYCVLAFSKDYPELLRYTDNIRILERLAKTGLIPAEKTEKVIETYRYYRSLGHRLALKQAKSVVDVALVQEQREAVLSYWEQLFSAVNAA